ncbi:DNA-binding NtrC family response regulator [Pseudomonas lini]|uniref:response regulator n=1 Tax=Pseudomonas lini TaxID=163011 RepID=UPI0027815CAE|nr:response regulator [Pseudomonas lini]MDQ0121550.1 DNA-binding NtrC family response regulator [Pseudomonas lini]
MDVNYRLPPIDGEIVVVEDDALLRSLVLEILMEVGAHCVAFGNADDALIHMLTSHTRCALIIADHGLPGQIQGAELAALAHSRWPEIPAIITSGWSDTFIGLPPTTNFLAKPWTLEGLVMAVANTLQPGVPPGDTPKQ